MFQNVQRRLVFLYVLTSGIILTLALGITAFLYSQTVIRQQEAVFQANIDVYKRQCQYHKKALCENG